jgi:hypothetical protein
MFAYRYMTVQDQHLHLAILIGVGASVA